jgi:hypothetical protein
MEVRSLLKKIADNDLPFFASQITTRSKRNPTILIGEVRNDSLHYE